MYDIHIIIIHIHHHQQYQQFVLCTADVVHGDLVVVVNVLFMCLAVGCDVCTVVHCLVVCWWWCMCCWCCRCAWLVVMYVLLFMCLGVIWWWCTYCWCCRCASLFVCDVCSADVHCAVESGSFSIWKLLATECPRTNTPSQFEICVFWIQMSNLDTKP